MSGATGHRPVLAERAVDALVRDPEGIYVDATFGRGGHAALILERLGPGGRLLAIDRDPAAVAAGRARFAHEPRFTLWQGNFAHLGEALRASRTERALAGVLLDLGVSSPQLDDASRGFSFRADGPLDMRMDPSAGPSAAQWLATVSEDVLVEALRTLGEERFARRIARAVVRRREEGAPVETTGELAALVAAAVPNREPGKHPATRTFQALRMVVNDELPAIESALMVAADRLAPGGRLVVISFHSLEDRLVKRFLRARSRPPAGSRRLPVAAAAPPDLATRGKAQRPTAEEVADNPRARSAVMRVAEKRHAP